MFGWLSPGFTNTSNDNTRPTTDVVFPLGADWDEVSFDVFDVVCEAVAGAGLVAFASVWAADCGAELTAVGALEPSVVVWELCTELVVGAVTVEDWVVRADVLEVGLAGFRGLTGDTGLATFVGLVIDFTQVLDVVTQGCHTGFPYGFGHVEERVWIMLPV
jgi:hypothetical protein